MEEVEKIKKLIESAEPSQEQWQPEMRRALDPEQGSMRGLRDHDRGRRRVPEPGAHMNAPQANYARLAPNDFSPPRQVSKAPSLVPQKPDEIELPAPKMRSPMPQFQEIHPHPRHRSQSSAGAGLHFKSTRQQYPKEYTLTNQSHQASFQPHKSQHRASHKQVPIEQPPSKSSRIARHGYGKPAAENTKQLPLQSARAPVQLGRERAPSTRGPEPRWETKPRSVSIARGERGYAVAGTARQLPSQRSRGPVPLGRERGLSSVRGEESRQGLARMAGSLVEDEGERGGRRGGTKRFA